MICTFFGHSDCPSSIIPKLKTELHRLIVDCAVDRFYVGNHGNFDGYVRSMLKELKSEYPHITYYVVLAYLPRNRDVHGSAEFADTILADGVENIPRRFAISYRNKWMVEQADYVVTYITRSVGGAVQFVRLAEKKNKICINLAPESSVLQSR